MKALQRFSDEYLESIRDVTPDEAARFLEDFRRLREPAPKSRLISMRVPEPLLASFRMRCKLEGARYQTRIKELMAAWVESSDRSATPR